MPSFFLWSDAGDGAFLARRLEAEGHAVRLYIHDQKAKNVYSGLLKAPAVKRPDPAKGEIIIFDMVKFGPQADSFRRRGWKVIGGSKFTDAIEINRPAGADVMRKIGIKIPETKVFRALSDGQRFLRGSKGKWYYKPSGNLPTATTHNGEPESLIRYLEWTKREPPEQFELQRAMDGTEISLEGWFDGKRWVWPFNSTVEDKKLMAGDHGPRTGCMANVVWAYEDSRPVLALKTVVRIAPYLEAAGYVGPVDLNMIVDKDGEPHGLEWSARFGYDALQALCCLTEGDLGAQLAEFAKGSLSGFSTRTDAYGMTLRLSVPPFPDYAHAKDARGLPLDPKLARDPMTYLGDVMQGPNGLALAGADGGVAAIGAVGTDLSDLRRSLVVRAEGYDVPNLQFRIDPVQRTESVLAALDSFSFDQPRIRATNPPVREMQVSTPEMGSDIPPPATADTRPSTRTAMQRMPPAAVENWDMPTFTK